MNRRYYIFTFLVSFAVAVFAQTTEEQKKKINSIKKDRAYLYAEITTDNQQSALDLAEDMLNQEINKYVAEQKKLRNAQNIVLRNRQEVMETISLPRGNMFRAFKFVKKGDIIAADNVEVRNNATATNAQGTTETPLQSTVQTVTAESAKRSETIARLLAVSKFADLSDVVKQLKRENRIGQYAKIKELANPEQFVLVIYNREGDIEAVLSEGSARTNLRTGQADNVSNYPGRGAVGVKINN